MKDKQKNLEDLDFNIDLTLSQQERINGGFNTDLTLSRQERINGGFNITITDVDPGPVCFES